MNLSGDEFIGDPSLRPLDPDVIPPIRRRSGFVLFGIGFVAVIIGGFVSFGHWFFVAGSVLIIAAWFVFNRFRGFAEKTSNIRKLYARPTVTTKLVTIVVVTLAASTLAQPPPDKPAMRAGQKAFEDYNRAVKPYATIMFLVIWAVTPTVFLPMIDCGAWP